MSSILTTNGTTTSAWVDSASITASGTMIAKDFKIAKDPNKFYEYNLRVLNLKELKEPAHDRLMLDVKGTVELAPKIILRDYVLLKHGAEIAAIGSLDELTIEVTILKSYNIGNS